MPLTLEPISNAEPDSPFDVSPDALISAARRIAPYIHHTPLLNSERLNAWLGHEVVFKIESHQKVGAFKARGAINALLRLKEQGKLPKQVVAYSSGNHAQAVAWAASVMGIEATIYLPKIVSPIKKQATISYGAKVIEVETRKEAEARTLEAAASGMFLIPPYDHDDVMIGQGTACLEALQDGVEPDAIFVCVGGGGLASGTWLAAQLFSSSIEIYAGEPLLANDAAASRRTGTIFRFHDSPKTIADGARTLSLSPRTFHYIQKLNGIFEIEEESIIYWTQWLQHLLKISCEPTSALSMAAAFEWLKMQRQKKHVLVIISGGNIDPETHRAIWQTNHLLKPPLL